MSRMAPGAIADYTRNTQLGSIEPRVNGPLSGHISTLAEVNNELYKAISRLLAFRVV